MSERLVWLDSLRGFAIFTVVLGHCIDGYLGANIFPSYNVLLKIAYDFIYSFHMPLFFCISGFAFYLSKTYKKYKIKFWDIVLLYLFWSVFQWCFKIVLASHVNKPLNFDDLLKIFYVPMVPYWYLYVLACLYLVFSKIGVPKIKLSLLCITGILGFIINHYSIDLGIISTSVYYMYFFALGGHLCTMNLHNRIQNKNFIICVAICIVNCILYLYKVNFTTSILSINPIIVASAGSIVCFYIFYNWKIVYESNILKMFGVYSLQIYVIHSFITAGSRIIFKMLGIINLPLYLLVGMIFGIFIPIIIGKYCAQNEFLNLPFAPIKGLKKVGVIKNL